MDELSSAASFRPRGVVCARGVDIVRDPVRCMRATSGAARRTEHSRGPADNYHDGPDNYHHGSADNDDNHDDDAAARDDYTTRWHHPIA
jgi:hypothetical protein